MNATPLIKHAAVYMGGLRLIINSLDDDEKMTRALRKIAHAHVKWNIQKSHIMVSLREVSCDPDRFQNMLVPLVDVIQENYRKDPEIHEAWSTLFDVIANLIEIYRASETKLYYGDREAKYKRGGLGQ